MDMEKYQNKDRYYFRRLKIYFFILTYILYMIYIVIDEGTKMLFYKI